jgi:hypothetical protein
MINLFYFLSKTDEKVVRNCPESTKNIHATMGFFVLITGVVAFISGSYAISNMFIHENPINGRPEMIQFGWVYSMLIGGVYATFIMAIDREIVSANTRWAAALRIPLAVVISLIVSVPVELQIFEAKINKHLAERHNIENDSLIRKLEHRNRISEIETEIKHLKEKKLEAIRKKSDWAEAIEAEVVGRVKEGRTGKAGKGIAYDEAIMNKQLQEEILIKSEAELMQKFNDLKLAKQVQDREFKDEKISQSYDLLSKYIALKEVKNKDITGSATAMGYGVMVLFMLFELIPSIIKLFLPQTEYDVLLNNRRRLNIHAAKTIFRQSYSDYEGMSVDEIQTSNHIIIDKMFKAQTT